MFVERRDEKRAIDTFYRGAERLKIVRVEGRSGSGKTEFCREFAKDKPAICIWGASPTDNQRNLHKAALSTESFIRSCLDKLPSIRIPDEGFDSWGRFFCALCAISAATSSRITLVLDDYANLCAADATFGTAFKAAFDVLWGAHLFVLLTGEHESLAACDTPAKLDSMLAESTNVIQMRPLGMKAADLASPQTAWERVSAYAQKGGVPARYAAQMSAGTHEAASLETVLRGMGLHADSNASAAKVVNALAHAANPYVGISVENLVESTGLNKHLLGLSIRELTRLGIVSRMRVFSYPTNGAEGGDDLVASPGRSEAPDEVAIVSQSDFYAPTTERRDMLRAAFEERLRLVDPGDISALNPVMAGFEEMTFSDMCREWLWDALHAGDFPFEFESVGYWFDPKAPGRDVCASPAGLIALNNHYHKAIACICKMPGESLDEGSINAFSARVAQMPFEESHLAIVTCGPVDQNVTDYASSVRNLTLARLTEEGVTVISNPWKLYSRRYRERQTALIGGNEEQANSTGTSGINWPSASRNLPHSFVNKTECP